MNDFELERMLRAVQVPPRDKNYWETFPRGVLAKLRAAPARRSVECRWLPKLAWGAGFAVACLLMGFAIGLWHGRTEKNDPYALLQNAKMLREVLTMFPNRVRAIVQDERGVQLVLSDQADVPTSTPLWVRICDGKRCASLVTFSGQEIEIAGRKITVLAEARGGIILTGDRFAWSSTEQNYAQNSLKIEARRLNAITL